MPPPLTIRTAREEEWPAALQFIFQSAPDGERAARIANGIDMVRRGELHREGIWVAIESNLILGAMICLKVPGASALVWPPQAKPGERRAAIEDALMTECSQWLHNQGVRVAQSLHEEKDQQLAEPLSGMGFKR